MIVTKLLIRALIFRQDYRIKKIFLPFLPIPLKAGKKGKNLIPFQGKAFNHCTNKTVKQGEKHPLLAPRPFFPLKRNCVFSASSPSAIGCALGECRAGGIREKKSSQSS